MVRKTMAIVLALSVMMGLGAATSVTSDNLDSFQGASAPTAEVSLNFKGDDALSSFEIGFTGTLVAPGTDTSVAVTPLSTVEGSDTANIALGIGKDGKGTLGDSDVYVYWKISSATPVNIYMYPDAAMDNGESDSPTLDWTVGWTPVKMNESSSGNHTAQTAVTAGGAGKYGESNKQLVYGRESGFKVGDVGSVKIDSITTDNVGKLTPGTTYSANLVIYVEEGTAGGTV